MTFLIAAAGTGGHVFPGLSVGEGLVELGVPNREVLYVGGDRLEATVFPREGYRFLQVELVGLKRSLSLDNVRIPLVVSRARRRIAEEIVESGIRVVLGMGGYVTVPAGLAARKARIPFFNAEQNAEAGLANRFTARWAVESFTSFPETGGLPDAVWVGNPVRSPFWSFDRRELRPEALSHFELEDEIPVLGVFGGSLGAGVINDAVRDMLAGWNGPDLQVVHLTGRDHLEEMLQYSPAPGVTWRRLGFEDSMELFFAACDLVVARAGGAVAEITASGTPSILVPGEFGSGGHQARNAAVLSACGAAEVVTETELANLGEVVGRLITDRRRREEMAQAAHGIAKPDAALSIARRMIEAAR